MRGGNGDREDLGERLSESGMGTKKSSVRAAAMAMAAP
jgi:hypothetical protein